MPNRYLVLVMTIAVVAFAGCTPKSPSTQIQESGGQTENAMPQATTASGNAMMAAEPTAVPLGTVPPTVDKATQSDIKQMDDMLDKVDSNTYSGATLKDLE